LNINAEEIKARAKQIIATVESFDTRAFNVHLGAEVEGSRPEPYEVDGLRSSGLAAVPCPLLAVCV
jgi:hypothetical protein